MKSRVVLALLATSLFVAGCNYDPKKYSEVKSPCAVRDLNGDGKNDLIVLESKFGNNICYDVVYYDGKNVVEDRKFGGYSVQKGKGKEIHSFFEWDFKLGKVKNICFRGNTLEIDSGITHESGLKYRYMINPNILKSISQ